MIRIQKDAEAQETNQIRDSRNFWKWVALVSWISAALVGALRMFPLH
ncbi:MAG TPA: hypothetical protein VE994_21885 [Terriglobales bacterium]|nr:hypothetical protein [Terriglobales bacterium]